MVFVCVLKHFRSKKKKCVPSATGLACRLCTTRGLRCDAPTMVRDSPNILPPLNQIESASRSSASTSKDDDVSHIVKSTLNNSVLRDELIETYFRVMHYNQQLLFHHNSFLRDLKHGLVAKYILLAIFALSARYVPKRAEN